MPPVPGPPANPGSPKAGLDGCCWGAGLYTIPGPGLAPGAGTGKPDGVGGLENEPGELKPAQELGRATGACCATGLEPLKLGLGQEPGRADP